MKKFSSFGISQASLIVARATLAGASTVNLNAAASDKPPLCEPHLEAEGGWLAPNGDYYGCNHEANQRHEATANLIVEKFDLPIADDENPQEYLCDMGWIRIDIEGIQFEQVMPSPKQMNTLRQLSLIDDPKDEWRLYMQPEVDMFIQHYEAKRKRNKLGY